MKISSLVSCYHEKNKNEDVLQTSTQETRSRKQSASDKKVTFSVSDEVETAVEPDYQEENEVIFFVSCSILFLLFVLLLFVFLLFVIFQTLICEDMWRFQRI